MAVFGIKRRGTERESRKSDAATEVAHMLQAQAAHSNKPKLCCLLPSLARSGSGPPHVNRAWPSLPCLPPGQPCEPHTVPPQDHKPAIALTQRSRPIATGEPTQKCGERNANAKDPDTQGRHNAPRRSLSPLGLRRQAAESHQQRTPDHSRPGSPHDRGGYNNLSQSQS